MPLAGVFACFAQRLHEHERVTDHKTPRPVTLPRNYGQAAPVCHPNTYWCVGGINATWAFAAETRRRPSNVAGGVWRVKNGLAKSGFEFGLVGGGRSVLVILL